MKEEEMNEKIFEELNGYRCLKCGSKFMYKNKEFLFFSKKNLCFDCWCLLKLEEKAQTKWIKKK